jgi:hypothetical protein
MSNYSDTAQPAPININVHIPPVPPLNLTNVANQRSELQPPRELYQDVKLEIEVIINVDQRQKKAEQDHIDRIRGVNIINQNAQSLQSQNVTKPTR